MKIKIDIIIPVFNEEKFIKKCLDAILSFEIPKDVECKIFIVDGGSNDQTLSILQSYLDNHLNLVLLHNIKKFQSYAMNLALKSSEADFIMRLDAHSIYPKNYLALCYETMRDKKVQNTGGIIETLPGSNSYGAQIVQALTTHKFGVGNSGFRTEFQGGYVDTVPFGFFTKEIFEEIGVFNESLVRAQDYEFNKRILKNGGKIWLNPEIKIKYFNQSSFLKFFKKQFFLEAPYNAYMWYLAPYTFAYRHAITGVFTLGFFGGLLLSPFNSYMKFIYISVLVLYALISLISAFQQAYRYNFFRHLIFLPFSFFCFHIIHGLGIIMGLIKILFKSSPVQKLKY